ncbi:MAG: 30S ribosomal protein S9 [Phycisphaerales bacterium]|nr:30S ribosomal protein S9 [Phycisphaerales bacterium]
MSTLKSETTPGLGLPTVAAPAPAPRVINFKHGPEAQKFGWWWGTGRRKSAIARVRIRPGDGTFKVNGREVNDYFTEERDRNDVVAPLKSTDMLGKLEVQVTTKGGGYMGQAGAIVLGLARALRLYDANVEPILRENNYLTRDPREVERKKYGQAGARRRFQFSKR